jgi:hypothetical protein
MTRLLLTLSIILTFSTIASAQFSKGNVLLLGTLSYSGSSSTYNGTTTSNNGGVFSLSPGKAISENSVVGISLSYGFSSNSSTAPGNNKSNSYSIGVFYRKYKALGKDFYLFGAASAGYNGSTSSSTDDLGNKYASGNSNGGFIGFTPGIDYKISNKFLLEFSIPSIFYASYTSTKTTLQNQNPADLKSSQFGISTSLTSNPLSAIGVGFVLVL